MIQRLLAQVPAYTAGATLLLGLLVLLGWVLKSSALLQVFPEYPPMQFNTALCFVLISFAVICRILCRALNRLTRNILIICGLIVVAIAGATISEYLFNLNVGIDTFFATPFTSTNTAYPGRISLMTSSGFLLSALSLFTVVRLTEYKWLQITGTLSSVLLIALGVSNIAGYLLGKSTPYAWTHSSYMAIHTSIGFVLLGVSLSFYMRSEISKHADNNLTYTTLLPFAVLSLTTVIILWQITYNGQQSLLDDYINKQARMFSLELSETIARDEAAIQRMVFRWNRHKGKPDVELWEFDALNYIENMPSLKSMLIVSRDGRIEKKRPETFKTELPLEQIRLIESGPGSSSPRQEYYLLQTDKTNTTEHHALVAYPLRLQNNRVGYLVVLYNVQQLFWHHLANEQIDYGLVIYKKDKPVFRSFQEGGDHDYNTRFSVQVKLFSETWRLELYPPSDIAVLSGHWYVLVTGLFLTGIVLLLLYLRHINQQRTVTLASVNQQLSKEVEQRRHAEEEVNKHKENLEQLVLERTVEVYETNQDLEDEIAKRQRSEQDLKESNSRFEQFANNTPHALWLMDAKAMQMIYGNPATENLWGYTPDQLCADPELRNKPIHPDDQQNVIHAFEASLNGDTENFDAEYRINKPNGETIWVHDHGVPIYDDNGVIQRYAGIAEDITLRKNAELALQESEENYRQIVESTNEGILVTDNIGSISFANSRLSDMLGYSNDKLLGRSLVDFIISDSLPGINSLFITPGNQSQKLELVFRDKAGEQLTTNATITSIFSGDGDGDGDGISNRKYKGSLILITDISHEVLANKERETLEHQLKQAQKMESIGQLTGGIAHDFNNILASVLGFTELSQECCDKENKKLNDYLNEVLTAGSRAQDLIQKMLTFSRGTAGQLKPLPLAPLIKETIKLLRPTIPSSIKIILDIQEELQEIKADVVQIHQLLMNLCINARDAMHGSGVMTVSLKQQNIQEVYCASCFEPVTGEYIVLAVEDVGEGITDEQITHIFDPFFTTKEIGKGSGMGLPMVHGITHEHHGHIIVRSEPGKGTRFEILFRLNNEAIRKAEDGE